VLAGQLSFGTRVGGYGGGKASSMAESLLVPTIVLGERGGCAWGSGDACESQAGKRATTTALSHSYCLLQLSVDLRVKTHSNRRVFDVIFFLKHHLGDPSV
jgi:hypothetical protein